MSWSRSVQIWKDLPILWFVNVHTRVVPRKLLSWFNTFIFCCELGRSVLLQVINMVAKFIDVDWWMGEHAWCLRKIEDFCAKIHFTWKFILLSSTGSEGAITEAFCISKPDIRGVMTCPESIGCLSGCRRLLKTITSTTSRASPIPATTGPTTQSRDVREGWEGMRSQSTSSQWSDMVAGGRVADGM